MTLRINDSSYRSILFDMDGVIVDSMPHHADSWIRAFREWGGIELTREDIYRREGMSGAASILDILADKGLPVPPEPEIDRLREIKYRIFEEAVAGIFIGVPILLEMLADADIAMGLVTGSMLRTVRHVLPPHIRSYFRAIVTGSDITHGKPHPEPYLTCLARLGVSPEHALAVENAPMGIRSAKSAGLFCVAIQTTLDARFLVEADMIVRNHDELREYLQRSRHE